MNSQIDKIQSILKKEVPKPNKNTVHFSAEEKCTAIANFMKKNVETFNLDFVESVHSYFLRRGAVSDAQLVALDRIIKKYKINISMWGM